MKYTFSLFKNINLYFVIDITIFKKLFANYILFSIGQIGCNERMIKGSKHFLIAIIYLRSVKDLIMQILSSFSMELSGKIIQPIYRNNLTQFSETDRLHL
jgi:hypothetical protein